MTEFMSVPTQDLVGSALDWAVGTAVGHQIKMFSLAKNGVYIPDAKGFVKEIWAPSTDWSQGGPLIKKYMVAFACFPEDELKTVWAYCCSGKGEEYGQTHLIAACRAIVASVLGETVSVPKELT